MFVDSVDLAKFFLFSVLFSFTTDHLRPIPAGANPKTARWEDFFDDPTPKQAKDDDGGSESDSDEDDDDGMEDGSQADDGTEQDGDEQ